MKKTESYKKLETIIFDINKDKSYLPRIKKELSYIKSSDSANFFLLVFDLVNDLKQKNVIIGPISGYGNSSLINYLLGITSINPIKYELVCELYYFGMFYPTLKVYVSDKKKISKKFNMNKIEFYNLPLLKKYLIETIKVDYNFYPEKLNTKGVKINFSKVKFIPKKEWEVERTGMIINNENDLINSLALARPKIKGFLLSKMLQNKHILFKELEETNGLLIFQEQWVNLVSKYTNESIEKTCIMKVNAFLGLYSINSFMELFPKTFNMATIEYLFETLAFLHNKSHTVPHANLLCASINFK